MIDKIKNENPLTIIVTGDFNGRSPTFWDGETIGNYAGKHLVEFAALNGLSQLITEPTHFPQDHIKTCVDHIYTDAPEGFVDTSVIYSPDPKCKHSIIQGTLNFSVPPPPPYKKVIWKYNQADIENIRSQLGAIDWFNEFENRSSDECVTFFTSNVLSIMNSNIPNTTITVNENDAPWMTAEVKSLIKRKQRILQRYKHNKSPGTYNTLKDLQYSLSERKY